MGGHEGELPGGWGAVFPNLGADPVDVFTSWKLSSCTFMICAHFCMYVLGFLNGAHSLTVLLSRGGSCVPFS